MNERNGFRSTRRLIAVRRFHSEVARYETSNWICGYTRVCAGAARGRLCEDREARRRRWQREGCSHGRKPLGLRRQLGWLRRGVHVRRRQRLYSLEARRAGRRHARSRRLAQVARARRGHRLPTERRTVRVSTASRSSSRAPSAFPGFGYPVSGAKVELKRIRIGTSTQEVYREWCDMQQPYLQAGAFPTSYGCVNGFSSTGNPPMCMTTGPDGMAEPVDCGKAATCSTKCQCTETKCGINARHRHQPRRRARRRYRRRAHRNAGARR